MRPKDSPRPVVRRIEAVGPAVPTTFESFGVRIGGQRPPYNYGHQLEEGLSEQDLQDLIRCLQSL